MGGPVHPPLPCAPPFNWVWAGEPLLGRRLFCPNPLYAPSRPARPLPSPPLEGKLKAASPDQGRLPPPLAPGPLPWKGQIRGKNSGPAPGFSRQLGQAELGPKVHSPGCRPVNRRAHLPQWTRRSPAPRRWRSSAAGWATSPRDRMHVGTIPVFSVAGEHHPQG